jgi:queuine tRNA-ribosyltransferase subunit QTRTD1
VRSRTVAGMTSFAVTRESGGARCGTLTTPGGAAVATPALLLFTRAGAPVHLTDDALATLPAAERCLGINPCSFLGDLPSAEVVAAAGGASAFLGLGGSLLFASPREPYAYDTPLRRANDAGVAASTSGGMRRVTPAGYAAALAALRVDAAVALSDEVPPQERPKRQRTAVERTTRWLRELAAAAPAAGVRAGLWASLQGGSLPDERARAASAAAAVTPPVAGFSLGGLGAGEAPEERPALLAASITPLPPGAPRHVAGLGAPEEVLQCAAAGVDLFDGAYPHLATTAGCALTFAVCAAEERAGDDAAAAAAGDGTAACGDGFKVNLRARCFRTDVGPLLDGCTCFACTRHTRCVAACVCISQGSHGSLLTPHARLRVCSAYLHHLLDTHEMLGEVLLDLHNMHHYLRFFGALRSAIAAGEFPQFAAFHAARAQRARAAAAEAALSAP